MHVLFPLFRFTRQLARDIHFLKSHGLVDYSFLVGIQPLQFAHTVTMESPTNNNNNVNSLSFERQQSIAEIVTSLKRSSIGFANDADHEIRSASAKRRSTSSNGRYHAQKVSFSNQVSTNSFDPFPEIVYDEEDVWVRSAMFYHTAQSSFQSLLLCQVQESGTELEEDENVEEKEAERTESRLSGSSLLNDLAKMIRDSRENLHEKLAGKVDPGFEDDEGMQEDDRDADFSKSVQNQVILRPLKVGRSRNLNVKHVGF